MADARLTGDATEPAAPAPVDAIVVVTPATTILRVSLAPQSMRRTIAYRVTAPYATVASAEPSALASRTSAVAVVPVTTSGPAATNAEDASLSSEYGPTVGATHCRIFFPTSSAVNAGLRLARAYLTRTAPLLGSYGSYASAVDAVVHCKRTHCASTSAATLDAPEYAGLVVTTWVIPTGAGPSVASSAR